MKNDSRPSQVFQLRPQELFEILRMQRERLVCSFTSDYIVSLEVFKRYIK